MMLLGIGLGFAAGAMVYVAVWELLQEALGVETESWTSFAIRFALIHPIVTSLIVGLNTPEQVDEVLDAAAGRYPDRAVFDRALEVFRTHGEVES